MNYQTFKPSQDLSALIKCYWTLESPKQTISKDSKSKPKKQIIVPDGCLEMIFHYGDLYKQYDEQRNSFLQPRCFVFGQLTRPLEIESTGVTGIFSLRFYPNGFLPFATIPIKDMENTALPLGKLFGNEGQRIEKKY